MNILYRNKTFKTILFHLLVQCLFLLLHVESSHDTNGLRVTSLSETDRNDKHSVNISDFSKLTPISTAVNNERKSTFSLLYLRNCRVRSLILQQTERSNADIC